MQLRSWHWAVAFVFFAIGVSVLGGSLPGLLFGSAARLNIEGQAQIYRQDVEPLGEWSSYGGDGGGNRYVGADQISTDNVSQLKVAWTYRTGAFNNREHLKSRAAFQGTPILVNELLVFCTQFNDVIAIDAASGDERWRYDPKINLDARPANDFVCRGVSLWKSGGSENGPCNWRIFTGTADARLIALDAKTGSLCADFGQGGQIQIEPSVSLRWPGEYQITSAPAIIDDMVVVGSSISDNLRVAAPSGVVKAFDARTGEERWSFDPVPRDPADPARKTWGGTSADDVGHANVWSTMSVDEERGLVFLPTSSASPDFYGGLRPGNNLYTNSVVALDANTGDVVWHFQTVHHDVWDFDVPSQPGAYSVWRDGVSHDVIAQATKTGLVFVLHRDTGEPFLPVEERPTPQGGAQGEMLSPTQPFPVLTPAVVPSELSPGEAFGVTLWDKWACAAKIRKLRREGLFTPPSELGTLIYPFTGGGANWGSAAFDPSRNLMVVNMSSAGHVVKLIPAIEVEATRELDHDAEIGPMEGAPFGMSREMLLSPLGLPCNPPPWGVLAGIDLASGEIVWRKPIGTTEDLAPFGLALPTGTPTFGGPMITAGGLVFIGAAMDDYLRAFDVETGEEIWKGRLPAGGQATPMSYLRNGRQFVVIAAGGHPRAGTKIGDYVVAFALPR